MSSLEKAVQTQLNNIEKKTGKPLSELSELIRSSGLSKHSQIRLMLQQKFGLGYGDANTLVHFALQSDGTSQASAQGLSAAEVVDQIYIEKKAGLRPIHDRVMSEIEKFGPFEIVPKKGYLSLRRKKQFAMLGPTTTTRVELGLNAKDLPADERLLVQPKGSMCTYIVRLTEADQADSQVISWARAAYDQAG